MASDEYSTMLGELLEEAGLVSSYDLAEALTVATRLQTPIGRVLIMSGCVNEQTLTAAIEAQSLVRDKVITWEEAILALPVVVKEKVSLNKALDINDTLPVPTASTNRLGEILVEFGLITSDSLNRALIASGESGMPLGTVLTVQGLVPPALLPILLRTQEQIRDGTITRHKAAEDFKACYAMWAKAKESRVKSGDDTGSQGRLFLNNAKSDEAVSKSYSDYYGQLAEEAAKKLSASINVQENHPEDNQQQLFNNSQANQEETLKLPSYKEMSGDHVRSGRLSATLQNIPVPELSKLQATQSSPDEVKNLLTNLSSASDKSQSNAKKKDKSTAKTTITSENVLNLVEILKLGGFFTQKELQAAFSAALNDPDIQTSLLISIGIVNQKWIDGAKLCQTLLKNRNLKPQQAAYVLKSYRNGNLTIESALKEFGIDLQSQARD